MAILIIDALEAIKVKDQHGVVTRRGACAELFKYAAVQQTRKRIMGGVIDQLIAVVEILFPIHH